MPWGAAGRTLVHRAVIRVSHRSERRRRRRQGLDVNVRFRHVRDFEYTQEHTIFDLLDIGLVHGWLVDPQVRRGASLERVDSSCSIQKLSVPTHISHTPPEPCPQCCRVLRNTYRS